ncbi:hypothetical protein TRFO_06620 [Tritrichomonas foetus]|uniref:Uncharacterized protein n=1 Tax=Tritrichomonas foetus TaxID=1144522 RepID=A0A1J4JY70_9EUKA|nr:hypothetical protein TRFO_06620 [Tritrichomonas foetus]|eukprot:OHT03408.1 hypothetical protein TRFO_06620 [Tritrichomonas foetus]
MDSLLDKARCKIRSGTFGDLNEYEISFLKSIFIGTDNISKDVIKDAEKYFDSFDDDIQNCIVIQLFYFYFESPINHIRIASLETIHDIFTSNDNSNKTFPFFKEAMKVLEPLITIQNEQYIEIQQVALNILAKTILCSPEEKIPDFYRFIEQLVITFECTSLKFAFLFYSLIKSEPYPHNSLVSYMFKYIYCVLTNSKKDSMRVSTQFLVLALKNQFNGNFTPFFCLVPALLNSNDLIIQRNAITIISFIPEPPNGLFEFLMSNIETFQTSELSLGFVIICEKFSSFWKKDHAEQVIQNILPFCFSDNYQIKTIAIKCLFSYFPSFPSYSRDLCQLLIDNFENPLLTRPIMKTIHLWVSHMDHMDEALYCDMICLLRENYDNLEGISLTLDNEDSLILLNILHIIQKNDEDS